MTNVVIISSACCSPNMAVLDQQLRKLIDKAISETGIQAQVSVIGISTLFKNPNSKILAKLMDDNSKGIAKTPAILINDEVISYGIPTLDDIKQALIKFSQIKSEKENTL